MIEDRTISSIFDILSDIPVTQTLSVLVQCGISVSLLDIYVEPTAHFRTALRDTLMRLDENSRVGLCLSVVGLKRTICNITSPRYKFDERWSRFERSLALDGYSIRDAEIISSDPITDHLTSTEESLSELIRECHISEAEGIITSIKNSADDYLKQPPDFNGCLSNMRTALEAIAKSLAGKIQLACTQTNDTLRWGSAVSYLRSKEYLSEKEEKVLIAAYALLSELHRPIRIDESEMVRFARSIALAACWLLAKKATYENTG